MLRFDQLGLKAFQFRWHLCLSSFSTEALPLCEMAGDAAREEDEEVFESYRGRDPSVGRVV